MENKYTDLTNEQILERYKTNENLQNIRLVGDIKVLSDAHLEGAHLEGADLTGTALRDAHLEGAHLEGADLREAYFRGADLRGAHLRGADLRDADLPEAHLEGAHLEGAHLWRADLTGAHLEGAHLEGAELVGADLTGANLTGAFLEGANFLGAIVKNIILKDVKNREKAENLHLNRDVVNTEEEMTIVINSHGSSTLYFFLVPDNVNINTKADVGTISISFFTKSKNYVLYDPDWIKHSKGNIIPDFFLDTNDAKHNKIFGIYVLKGGPLTCKNYRELNKVDGCEDNNDDFLRITFDRILLSDLIKGLKEKFPDVKKINIYDISCNELDSYSAKQIQCFNLTGDLSKKTTPTKTVTMFQDGGLKRRSFIGQEDYKDKSIIKYVATQLPSHILGFSRTDHTENQDFSAFREYDYSEKIKEIIKNQSLLTKEGNEKMGRMLTEPFNMTDVCFLLVCVYLFVKNKGNENKEQLFKDIKTNTKEQETYKYKLKKFFNFSSSFLKKFALRANDILPSAKFVKFGRRRSQRKIKRRIDASRRHKHNLRSIKKRGVST